jgi:predicted GTPase
MFVCRLVARSDVLESRLRFRHRNDPAGLLWHLDRVEELSNILEAADIDNLVLDSSDIPASELAKAVRQAARWNS